MAHNRLSILDLTEEANQPMVDNEADLVIVFNGEIYNWQELRATLAREFTPRTKRSDTEVILLAYRKWGDDFLDHLHGMFAFALYDRRRRRMILARDRIGEKPLFYTWLPDGTFAFASEIKSLLATGKIDPVPNSDTIYHFLTMLAPEPGETFFAGVKKVKAGHMLVLDVSNSRPVISERCYWNVADILNGNSEASFEQIVDFGGHGLARSIDMCSIADTRMAVALSAGLDSSLNLYFSAKHHQKNASLRDLLAINVDYVGCLRDDSESPLAEQFAKQCGVEFLAERLSTDQMFTALDEVADWLVDTPVIFPHMAFLWLLSKRLRSEDIKVLLVGEGGDELGAYPLYFSALDQYRQFSADPPQVNPLLRELEYKGSLVSSRHCHVFREPRKRKFWRGPEPKRASYEILCEFMSQIDSSGEEGFARKIINLEYKLRLPEVLMPCVDYSTMAHSVEARSPFVADELISAILPTSFFERNKDRRPKAWLRSVGTKALPEYLLSQPKRGFGNEFTKMIGDELCVRWKRDLLGTSAPIFEFISPEFIKGLVDSHRTGGGYTTLFIPYTLNRWLENLKGCWSKGSDDFSAIHRISDASEVPDQSQNDAMEKRSLSVSEIDPGGCDEDLASRLRAFCVSRQLVDYEQITTYPRILTRSDIDSLLVDGGYSVNEFRIDSLLPPIDWNAHNRTFSYSLHAWDAIHELLGGYSRFAEVRCLRPAIAYAFAWLNEFQVPILGNDSPEELDALVRPNMPFAWYDMAVGLRANRIAFLLDVMTRDEATPDSDLVLLWKSLKFHLALLNRDHFFRRHSNHGFYQALGHLAASRRFRGLPEMEAEYQNATRRVSDIVEAHFSSDGCHLEHSPGYHYMLMEALIYADRDRLLAGTVAETKMAAMEEAMVWMTTPSLELVTFGDTNPQSLSGRVEQEGLSENPNLKFIFSGGRIGASLPIGVKEFKETGYAMARMFGGDTPRDEGRQSFLAMNAAFHSRVHKHADHLSFVWHDRGGPILVDPGRFAYFGRTEVGSELWKQGFWYSDPKRIYVESTRAHNCIEVDGQSYSRKGVKCFGSALTHASEVNGMAVIVGETLHLQTLRHRRLLVMRPGHFLLVFDWLFDRTAEHEFVQWTQFDQSWETRKEGSRIVAERAQSDRISRERVTVLSMLEGAEFDVPVRGQSEPELQGWMSDKADSLVPSPSVALRMPKTSQGCFATLFVLGESATPTGSRVNNAFRAGRFDWSDDRGRHKVQFHIPASGPPSAVIVTN